MLQHIAKRLHGNGQVKSHFVASRVVAALALALLMPVAVCAYTVVMRGGRRIEIPNSFTVTNTTLTYEAAPGINITLQMSNIDILATERANNEPTGSLLKRAEQHAAAQDNASAAATSSRAKRTLTNRDLEATRRAREKSEAAYEQRRRELGLPSPEETRRRLEKDAQKARERSRQSAAHEAEAEAYWRERANGLRTEIETIDAEINYVRARLAESPEGLRFIQYPTIIGGVPAFARGHGAIPPPVITTGDQSFGLRNRGTQASGVVRFGGGATRGQVAFNTFGQNSNFRRRAIASPGAFFSPVLIFPAPFFYGYSSTPFYGGNSSLERSVLVTRLHELEARRAGLMARWRLLEDEARRAGAPPGWLRP